MNLDAQHLRKLTYGISEVPEKVKIFRGSTNNYGYKLRWDGRKAGSIPLVSVEIGT